MMTSSLDKWLLRSGTFLVWMGALACAVFWGLKMSGGAPSTGPAPVALAPSAAPDPAALARLLGAAAQPSALAPTSSRLVLVGVLAGQYQGGAALVAVDGKTARPVRIGQALEEGLVLQSLHARRAVFGPAQDGPATLSLEMAAPPHR